MSTWGVCKSKKRCLLIAYCLRLSVPLFEEIKRYSARKVMEFNQTMTDILVNVSCKFEMYIFKIAHVINENVRTAFLYVLIYMKLCFYMLVGFRKLHIGLQKTQLKTVKKCFVFSILMTICRQYFVFACDFVAAMFTRSDTMRAIMHRIYGTFYHIEAHKQIDIFDMPKRLQSNMSIGVCKKSL